MSAGASQRKILERNVGIDVGCVGNPIPGPIATEPPGEVVISHHHIEYLIEAELKIGVFDRRQSLHPTIKIPAES